MLNVLMSLSEKKAYAYVTSTSDVTAKKKGGWGEGGGRKGIISRSGELGFVCLNVLYVKNLPYI